MEKLKTFMGIMACFLVIELVIIACVMSGFIEPVSLSSLTPRNTASSTYEKTSESDKTTPSTSSGSGGSSVTSGSEDGDSGSGESEYVSSEKYNSVLTVNLSGSYLTHYNKAVKRLSNSDSDNKRKLITKIGLQILQSKVIKYENALHFYSLSYSSSGGSARAVKYNLKDCISRINSGKRIYTDCFGFVRLTHTIACYSINPSNPGSVSGLSGLYGYVGAYTGSSITSLDKLSAGTVLYDRLTGSNGDRHVAMYLYEENGTVYYMDQSRIASGTHKNSSYIYSPVGSNPYKFNKFKSYC